MKKALLVGINNYPSAPLRGCVNDCLLMHKILTEKFGFDKSNITLLLDEDALKENILFSLKRLALNAKEGDILYFHFSGHGSQVVVNDRSNTSETDGLDEIICPYDLDWNDPLRDNDFNAIIKTIPTGVNALFVLDCCHSGTGLRNTFQYPEADGSDKDWVNRFLPPPPSNLLRDSNITLDDTLHFVHKNAKTKDTGFMVHTVEQGDAILISGCRDNQVSADAWMFGRYQGALTWMMGDILARANYKITFRDLILKVNEELKRSNFTQEPQLESRKRFFDQEFLNFDKPKKK